MHAGRLRVGAELRGNLRRDRIAGRAFDLGGEITQHVREDSDDKKVNHAVDDADGDAKAAVQALEEHAFRLALLVVVKGVELLVDGKRNDFEYHQHQEKRDGGS